MASTSNYTVTRDQIISSALRKLGVLELGDTPDPATVANAAIILNLFIKQMGTEGIKLWTVEEGVLPLIAGQTSYTLGGSGSDTFYLANDVTMTAVQDKPLKFIQSWIRNTTSNIDTPLLINSKQEYNILGSKFSTGVANTAYYDPRNTYGYLYLFLTPDVATATNYQLHFNYQRPIYDVSYASSNVDFPNEWLNVLVWNLADQLALEYGVPQGNRQEIGQRAVAYKTQLLDWDVEYASTFFKPDPMNNPGRP